MALELHIFGPALDTVRVVHPGEAELILGRDAECSVSLPDPERMVSRRHIALWNVDDVLHFRVLSSINGIDMPFGYAPPGANGILQPGQLMKIGEYSAQVRPAGQATAEQDPWAVFDRPGASSADATLPRTAVVVSSRDELSGPVISAEEDPFGDWGFESTFGPASNPGALKAVADGPAAGDLAAFYKGLGLDTVKLNALTAAELEAAGRAIRIALEGLFELYASRYGAPREQRSDDGSVVPVKDNNPLKTHWPDDTKLQYLFGGRAGSIGFVSPQRALTDVVGELLTHDAAVSAATRASLEGTLQEFAPSALKDRLLGVGSKLFEGARAWDAYSRYYTVKSQGLDEWVEQLLDRYFKDAYSRESQRIKRETGLKPD
jgi:predicted component of type VI protein secretion system